MPFGAVVNKFFSALMRRAIILVVTAWVILVAISFVMVGAVTGLTAVFATQPWIGWVVAGSGFLLTAGIFLKLFFGRIETKVAQKKNEIKETFDLSAWTRSHPFQATGTAAVAGFIAGEKLVSPETLSAISAVASVVVADIMKDILFPIVAEQLAATADTQAEPSADSAH